MHFGQWVKEYRETHNWTQTECAKRGTMTVQQWNNMETSQVEDPRVRTIDKVAEAFGISPDSVLSLSGLSKARTPNQQLAEFLDYQVAQVDPADQDRYRTVMMRTAEAVRVGFAPA